MPEVNNFFVNVPGLSPLANYIVELGNKPQKPPEWVPTKHGMGRVDYTIMYVGHWWSGYAQLSLPSLYHLRYSCDNLFSLSYTFSLLYYRFLPWRTRLVEKQWRSHRLCPSTARRISGLTTSVPVSQARPFPFHSSDRFQYAARVLKAIGAAELARLASDRRLQKLSSLHWSKFTELRSKKRGQRPVYR